MLYPLKIRKFDDFHLHLRQGKDLPFYLKETSKYTERALVMPNIIPPIYTEQDLEKYKIEILQAVPSFIPLMTIKLSPNMSPDSISKAYKAGAIAAKYYPCGATTHSEDGIKDAESIFHLFERMQELNMVLSIHGEKPDSFCLDRERDFLPTLHKIAQSFPKLRIVFEHVSYKESIELINSLSNNIAGTITPQHLYFTLNDALGDGMNPHLHCKPMLKTQRDKEALQQVVFSGNPKYFFGSDSAPHKRIAKESSNAPSGCFSSIVAPYLLHSLFSENKCIEKLEAFTSQFGADFYHLPYNNNFILIEKTPFTIPNEVNGAVPLCAGKTFNFSFLD